MQKIQQVKVSNSSQKISSPKYFWINILFLIIGIGIFAALKLYEFFSLGIANFANSSTSYNHYLLFKNYPSISFLLCGIGLLMFIKPAAIKGVALLCFISGVGYYIYSENTFAAKSNYPITKINFEYGYTGLQLSNYLLKKGFKKVNHPPVKDAYGNVLRSAAQYPYDFYKTDSINFLTQKISSEYALSDEQVIKAGLLRHISLEIYHEKKNGSKAFDYKVLKSLFYDYFKDYNDYYGVKPSIQYPELRTFDGGYLGSGSSFSNKNKDDIIEFAWSKSNEHIDSFTILLLNAAPSKRLTNLIKDNQTINIGPEDYYIQITHTVMNTN